MYSTTAPSRAHRLLLFLLTFAAVSLTHLAHAQTDQGRIAGVVADATGAIVPGASIIVNNERTGEERIATSSDSGF